MWKERIDERWGGVTIYCSYCKEKALLEYKDGLYHQVTSNFCPNCGANMQGGVKGRSFVVRNGEIFNEQEVI